MIVWPLVVVGIVEQARDGPISALASLPPYFDTAARITISTAGAWPKAIRIVVQAWSSSCA